MSATTTPEMPGPPDSLWGPYLSERQWGTVREDYSADGDAWNYFPHDHARSRAYRWGEDGLAGISDESRGCASPSRCGTDKTSILKERLFGLTNGEGNHGEDVKEYYYYLDATPDHSYLKMLYKYPQAAYPYEQLVNENGRRGLDDNEFELIDTGVFDENRYWDVFVEYFKATPEDILIQVTVHNRGPEAATLHLLPQLWFRNTWSWNPPMAKPQISARGAAMVAEHLELGTYYLYVEESAELLFCENETNVVRLYGTESHGYYKDAFHEYLVQGNRSAVNPLARGSKACAHLTAQVDAGASATFRLRLSSAENPAPFDGVRSAGSDPQAPVR